MAKVAVVLSGCGFMDGSEIHESVLCLLALAESKHQALCFAPDREQQTVVDHLTKQPLAQERNCLHEAARIARSEIAPLNKLYEKDFSALLLPGGFGAATSLSSWAEHQTKCTVYPPLAEIIRQFYQAKKPIGACCIAPVIVAKVLSDLGVSATLTLGSDPSYQKLLEKMGMDGRCVGVEEMVEDTKNQIYTTPCYMEPPDLFGMYQGIQKVVQKFSGH